MAGSLTWYAGWIADNVEKLSQYVGQWVLIHPTLGVLVHGDVTDFSARLATIKRSVLAQCHDTFVTKELIDGHVDDVPLFVPRTRPR